MPGCFKNGRWSESFGWKDVLDFKRPLYKLHELVHTKKDILVVGGNVTREKAQKLFPNYFVLFLLKYYLPQLLMKLSEFN